MYTEGMDNLWYFILVLVFLGLLIGGIMWASGEGMTPFQKQTPYQESVTY